MAAGFHAGDAGPCMAAKVHYEEVTLEMLLGLASYIRPLFFPPPPLSPFPLLPSSPPPLSFPFSPLLLPALLLFPTPSPSPLAPFLPPAPFLVGAARKAPWSGALFSAPSDGRASK
ncbi:unnamed protein product [Closterium sp. NIES-65]|nr:unnamed protein product [Closterium sp. NIES-65]